jgi:uncharacterized protein
MSLNMKVLRELLLKAMPLLEEQYSVARLGIFGSYVRNEQSENSDVDILVEFHDTPGFFKFLRLEAELERILSKKVDLVTKKALKPRIGERILNEVIYV